MSIFTSPTPGQIMQTIVWQPQPGPQMAFIECPVFEVFFGGARGGGKTQSSIGDWLQHSAIYGVHAVGIFVRRHFKDLAEVIATTKRLFKPLGAIYNEQRAEWSMPGGARLRFVHLDRDQDAESLQGQEFTRIYVEEIGNFPNYSPIGKIKACLRSGAGVPCGFRATGNPGGPGHQWVKARYIDPAPQGYKLITESEELEINGVLTTVSISRVFIPSKLTDNRLLLESDPTYILRLKQSGSEALVRAWLNGDWDAIEGAFFEEWDAAKHVLERSWEDKIPKSALRFRSHDWGSARPFATHWFALSDGTWGLPKDALFCYREWYGSSGPNKGLKMDAIEVGRGIKEQEGKEPIRYGRADPAIFIRNGGPSIAEHMAKAGCMWQRGDNKRIPGAEAMHCRLKGEGGVPMLYFSEQCQDLIRTLPMLQHDDHNAEDVDSDLEDHAYDSVRYGIMSRPWHPRTGAGPAPTGTKLPGEMTMQELLKFKSQKAASASHNV